MIDRIVSLGKILAVVSGLIGIYVFVAKAFTDHETARAWEARERTKVTIFRSLHENKSMTMEQLLSELQKEAIADPAIDRSELGESYLWRVLLELASSGMVMINGDRTVSLNRLADAVDAQTAQARSLERIQVSSELEAAIMALVVAKPLEFTVDDIRSRVTGSIGGPGRAVADEVFMPTISAMTARSGLRIDSDGKLSVVGWDGAVRREINNVLLAGPCQFDERKLKEVVVKRTGFPVPAVSSVLDSDIADGMLVVGANSLVWIGGQTTCN